VLTRVDRVIIRVADLQLASATYTNLGFDLTVGPESAVARNLDDCLELVAAPDARAGTDGLHLISIESDDLGSDVAMMRRRGVDIANPLRMDERTLHATLGPRNPLPLRFVQHLEPEAPGHARPGQHPNGIVRLDRVYIVTRDLVAGVDTYATVLGIPVPPIERGMVIKADMAIFDIGHVGIGVVTPVERGPAADALEQRGPGPFQILFRTQSMGAAVRWMVQHGVPPPSRAIRNTGEQAILVPAHHACGTYLAFVGPE
jgi:hypothetical protein